MRTSTAFLALCLFLVAPLFSFAQEEEEKDEPSVKKGKVLLGAYFSFSASTVEKTRVNRYTETDVIRTGINITVGKMLSDHWGLSLIAGYNRLSSNTPVETPQFSGVFENLQENYSIAPAVRYYVEISDATYFFVQGGIFVSRGKSRSDEFDGTSKVTVNLETKGFGVGLNPGISYFMTDKLSTEISIGVLGYSIVSGEDESGNKTVARTFESLLYLNSVSLGFVYYL